MSATTIPAQAPDTFEAIKAELVAELAAELPAEPPLEPREDLFFLLVAEAALAVRLASL